MLLTATATVVCLPFEAAYAASALALMLGVMGAQLLLGPYNKYHNKIHPVEWIVGQQTQTAGPYKDVLPWLTLLPVLHLLFWPAAWLTLFGVTAWLTPPALRLIRDYLRQEQLIATEIDKIRAFNPLVAVHLSGPSTAAYQVNQWLVVLEALDIPTIIIARERKSIPNIAPTRLPIVHARSAAHVEAVLAQGIKTVLYPANSMKGTQLLRQAALNHFFINHGESDKVVNQSKLLLAYDKLLVGGPLAEQRLKATGLPIRDGQIEHVGRPQAEMLLDKAVPNQPIKTLLYAPTWEGFVEEANYSSVGSMALDILQQLATASEHQVLFKPHPYTGLRSKHLKQTLTEIKCLCAAQEWEYIDPSVDIHDVMNRSDMLITDVSSVLNEYLVTGKPIILCINQRFSNAELEVDFPSSAAAYILRQRQVDMSSTLGKIHGADPLASKREWVRGESLGHFEGSALDRFKSVIQASIRS